MIFLISVKESLSQLYFLVPVSLSALGQLFRYLFLLLPFEFLEFWLQIRSVFGVLSQSAFAPTSCPSWCLFICTFRSPSLVQFRFFFVGEFEPPSSPYPDNRLLLTFPQQPDRWEQQWEGEPMTACGFRPATRVRAAGVGQTAFAHRPHRPPRALLYYSKTSSFHREYHHQKLTLYSDQRSTNCDPWARASPGVFL